MRRPYKQYGKIHRDRLFLHLLLEDLIPQMAVVEKVFITLHCHIALIGSFDRHIEKSAFRLFLLRKLDTYKSNIGVRRKTLTWCIFVFKARYSQAES